MIESVAPVRVIEETSAHWRVVFDHPPFNIVDATIFEGLQDLLARMDASPSLRVVVFESANPEFYLAPGTSRSMADRYGPVRVRVGPSAHRGRSATLSARYTANMLWCTGGMTRASVVTPWMPRF